METAWAQTAETIPKKHNEKRIDFTRIVPPSTDVVEAPLSARSHGERTPHSSVDASTVNFGEQEINRNGTVTGDKAMQRAMQGMSAEAIKLAIRLYGIATVTLDRFGESCVSLKPSAWCVGSLKRR